MDHIISQYASVPFGELNLADGLLYQRDVVTIPYDKDYYEKYISYEDTEIAKKINKSRTSITRKYCQTLLDIGIGSGEFIKKSKLKVFGYDINNYGVNWLTEKGLFLDPYKECLKEVEGVCFWDSLEHIPKPSLLLEIIRDKFVFISIPIFENLLKVRESKHYRPNEHLYYFTSKGLIAYMKVFGFKLVEISDAEIIAGREDVYTFVFNQS